MSPSENKVIIIIIIIICKWTEQVLCFLIDVLIELFYVFINLS